MTYSKQSAPALTDVDLELPRGEVIGVLGESGAGKSTLALSILGLLPADVDLRGSISYFDGAAKVENLLQLDDCRWRSIRGAKISLIFQDPMLSLSPVRRVGHQISDVLRAHNIGHHKSRESMAKEFLRYLSVRDCDRVYSSYPHQLSGGELHRVAIARALVCRPQAIIADEPTRDLDTATQAEVMDLLRNMNLDFGCAFVFITHNPALLADFADRVLVIHEGQIVEEASSSTLFRMPAHSYTRKLLQLASPSFESPRATCTQTIQETAGKPNHQHSLLLARSLSKRYTRRRTFSRERLVTDALTRCDLEIVRGSLTALVGESGSGKSTLANCLALIRKPDQGEIWFEGKEISRRSDRQLHPLRPKIQMIFQDSAGALNPRLSALEIIAEPLKIQQCARGPELNARALELMEEVKLPPHLAHRRPLELSGGQRQRVAIARAIALRPVLLILDEALSGLDLVTQEQILNLLLQIKAAHALTFLLISHDLSLVAKIADFVAVIHKGRVVEYGAKQQVLTMPRHGRTQQLVAAATAVESRFRVASAGGPR